MMGLQKKHTEQGDKHFDLFLLQKRQHGQQKNEFFVSLAPRAYNDCHFLTLASKPNLYEGPLPTLKEGLDWPARLVWVSCFMGRFSGFLGPVLAPVLLLDPVATLGGRTGD